jgi:hypothetical protein
MNSAACRGRARAGGRRRGYSGVSVLEVVITRWIDRDNDETTGQCRGFDRGICGPINRSWCGGDSSRGKGVRHAPATYCSGAAAHGPEVQGVVSRQHATFFLSAERCLLAQAVLPGAMAMARGLCCGVPGCSSHCFWRRSRKEDGAESWPTVQFSGLLCVVLPGTTFSLRPSQEPMAGANCHAPCMP